MRQQLIVAVVATASAAAPAQAATTATQELAKLRHGSGLRLTYGILYQAFGAALDGTGIATLALEHPTSPTPDGRLALVSGIATILSGIDSGYSGLPLMLAPRDLERRIANHGGEPALLNEGVALEILEEHARWARQWRLSTLVVSTVLLAANGAALAWYSARYTYERTTTAIVAGLYGLGVAVVPWYDSLPWPEEVAFANARSSSALPTASAPSVIRFSPVAMPTPQGIAVSMAVSGSW